MFVLVWDEDSKKVNQNITQGGFCYEKLLKIDLCSNKIFNKEQNNSKEWWPTQGW